MNMYNVRNRSIMPIKMGSGLSKTLRPQKCRCMYQIRGNGVLLLQDRLGDTIQNAVGSGSAFFPAKKIGNTLGNKFKSVGSGFLTPSIKPEVIERLNNLTVLDKKPKKKNVKLVI